MCAEVNICRQKYLITVIYRPPQTNDNIFLEYIEGFIDDHLDFDGNIILIGDFNIDFSRDTFYCKKLRDLFYKNALYQIVTTPTRITNNSETIIDYIVTNNKSIQHTIHTTPKISDHCMLSIQIDGYINEIKETITRSYKTYNVDTLHNELLKTTWNNNTTNVNELADRWTNSIAETINVMCPTIKQNTTISARCNK